MIYTRVICVMLMNSLSLPRVFCVLCVCALARARAAKPQVPRETHFTLQSLHSLPHDTHVLVVAQWDWPRKGTRHAGAPGGPGV